MQLYIAYYLHNLFWSYFSYTLRQAFTYKLNFTLITLQLTNMYNCFKTLKQNEKDNIILQQNICSDNSSI